MKVVIQKVSEASVTIENKIKAQITKGLLVLVGIEESDTIEDINWLSSKIVNLRVFEDENNVMNLSVKDIQGEIIVVSQFTLHALTKKGNRPSYIKAAKPEIAIPLYESFIRKTEIELGQKIQTGQFGADMKVSLVNDGPVTITIDSNDTPRERAVKMCQAINMAINQNMYDRLDDMARVFEYYQIVDTKAAKGEE